MQFGTLFGNAAVPILCGRVFSENAEPAEKFGDARQNVRSVANSATLRKGGVFTDVSEYLRAEMIVLIPVLYLIGEALKKSKVPNRKIPALLGVFGILLSAVCVLSTETFQTGADVFGAVFTAITQGVLAAGASVYTNQLYVQKKKSGK